LKYKDVNYINFSREEIDKLFSKAKTGDTNSFSDLSGYLRHISYTYFHSKYKLGKIERIEDVEDLANNVYLSFAEQYNKIENIEFWLRRVLFLNFINWYKKSRTNNTFELEEARYVQNNEISPADKLDAEKIIKLLNNLSEEKQSVVKLRFWEGLKFGEIAEQMNKSEDAVKKIFYRTLEELKSMI
jgi:RNA polymerase sigma-70 factor, ECF subfamily